MKKLTALLLALVLVGILAACGGGASSAPGAGGSPESTGTQASQPGGEGAEIAQVIIKGGTIDDNSFNQGAWEGVKKYAEDNGLTYKYYQATEDTVDGFMNAIDIAVKNGAKVVVAPGFTFESAIFVAQDTYPDIKFILLDGTPQDGTYTEYRIEKNVSSVFYAEEQAGFLAGYAAVKDGYRKLGFMGGMAVPAVMKFGYGFVQGAEYAGGELGLANGEIEMKYTYVGNYDTSPENQTLAASWYQSGTEIIFSCGGPVAYSVMAAAEQADAKVIGVDSDQAADSPTVVTSAVKKLGPSVEQILTLMYADQFPGGESMVFDVTADGVGLPMDTSRFETFSGEDYDAIYEKLVDDTDGLASSIKTDTDAEAADALGVSIVTVQIV